MGTPRSERQERIWLSASPPIQQFVTREAVDNMVDLADNQLNFSPFSGRVHPALPASMCKLLRAGHRDRDGQPGHLDNAALVILP